MGDVREPPDVEDDDEEIRFIRSTMVEANAATSTYLLDEKCQKENHLLKHLPYYNVLQNVTEKGLEKIILNLTKALICQDFQLGVDICTKSLKTYINLLGRKFSKEQHVKLINLFVEILTTTAFPLNLIPEIAETLNTLLEKEELLTRDDLCIPWRPLYETLNRCVFNRNYVVSSCFESKIKDLLEGTVILSNMYFEKNSVSEVIAEFTPMLCPTSPTMMHGLSMLELFLPFFDPEAEVEINKLIEHLLGYYNGWNNHPAWELSMINLFGNAAWKMPGAFDWKPYLPTMYARFMKNLGLPVLFNEGKSSSIAATSNSEESFGDSAADLIISTLGNNPVALKHLYNFLKTLETFYNQSNYGSWTQSLEELLKEMVRLFTLRLKKERYMGHKNTWWYKISDEHKLTDEDIDTFVKTTSSIVLDFYMELRSSESILRNLATIRPGIIIPAVMEKYDGIVETLIEPGKYITALQWVYTIVLPMVSSRKMDEGYDGRKFIIPFIMSLLPAIDANDMRKTLSALACLHELFNLISLVDCSSFSDKIENEDERELCIMTGCIEDFVLQFLDRIMSLLEFRRVENTRMADNTATLEDVNDEDDKLELFISSVFRRIATECSTKICKTVVKKIVSFALESTLETEVSGKLFASIVQSFVVARPDIILPRLLSPLCSAVKSHITDEILDDDDLDKTLLFKLLLLSYIMESSGSELLKYKGDIASVLSAALKLNGKTAYKLASEALVNFFQSLLHTYPTESRISEANYDDPNYLAINDWGVSADNKTIKIKWHVRSQEAVEWAIEVFLEIFVKFSSHLKPASTLNESNDEFNKRLLKNLRVLVAAHQGMSFFLRFWDHVPIQIDETVIDLSLDRFEFELSTQAVYEPNTGKLITKRYFEIYSEVLDYLKKFKADDTDAFIQLIEGFSLLLMPSNNSERRFAMSKSLINNLNPKKKYIRGGIITKAYNLHTKIIRCFNREPLTKGHVEILQKLFQLSINHYAKVRGIAQQRFYEIVGVFEGLGCRSISHFFVDYLKEGVHHDEFKGTLYALIGAEKACPLLHNSLEGISKLWLALAHSPFSEKDSVIEIMELIQDMIVQNFIYHPVQPKIHPNSRIPALTKALLSKSNQDCLGELKTLVFTENTRIVSDLLNYLTEAAIDGNVHWRRQLMCADMLSKFIIDDDGVPITKRMIEVFFEGLISHSIHIRNTAIESVSLLLDVFKREYPCIEVNPNIVSILQKGESVHSALQYKSKTENYSKLTVSENGQSFEIYIHKVYHGFAALPSKLKIKLPIEDYSDMSTGQSEAKTIVLETTQQYFCDKEYLQKLLRIWSLEEEENPNRGIIFQYVARNLGPHGLKVLLKLVHHFGKDKDKWKQKCAADILCGIICGMKLWDKKTTDEFWSELKPVFDDSLDNVTQETMSYWSSALSYTTSNRDPNKMRFFIEFLRERFMKSLETAQMTSVNAYREMLFFEHAIENVSWRVADVLFETLNFVKKHFFETPIPYMSVRFQLGKLLAYVFEWDVESPIQFNSDIYPKYEPFVNFVFENFKTLEEEAAKYEANEKDCEANAKIRKLLLKFKSTLEWIASVCWDGTSSVPPSFFRFIPLLCHFESYDPDPEIAQNTEIALSGLAGVLINPKFKDVLLCNLNEAANSSSWKARLCVLKFLKVFAMNNTSVFASSEKWSGEVVNLVLKLLSDRKLEVRELSSKILCGFLHCLIVQEPMELLKKFQKAALQFKKRRQEAREGKRNSLTSEEIDQAHSVILGLCSFIDTHPYHVPAFLPDVLVTLTTHLHDPQPIPTTIRKCLSNFRRTHHENWSVHKTKFSEDQLYIMTDIFVSPCYYA